MDTPETPQIYLISPQEIELSRFTKTLGTILDAQEIACIRLGLSTTDEDRISRSADAVREVAHSRDVAVVLSDHVLLAERLGLDGVHLTDAARSIRQARKTLGADAIVGSFCGSSKHDGMTAGEAGADYVSFGPVAAGGLGDGSFAGTELFQWWSEFIEVPVVAEGNLDTARIEVLAPHTDFFGIGDEIWSAEDPAQALDALMRAMA